MRNISTENMELVSSKKIRRTGRQIKEILWFVFCTPAAICSLCFLISMPRLLISDFNEYGQALRITLIDSAIAIGIVCVGVYGISICIYNLFGGEEIFIDSEKLVVRRHALFLHRATTIKLTDIIDITLDDDEGMTWEEFFHQKSIFYNAGSVNLFIPGKILLWKKKKKCGLYYTEEETSRLMAKIYEKRGYE